MPRLTVHRADTKPAADMAADASNVEAGDRHDTPKPTLTPLVVDRPGLAVLLCRSVASIDRDDAAGRLPAALRIGGSKRWRYSDIIEWVELGCPSRADFEALRRDRR